MLILVIKNRTPASWSFDFVDHSYDYRPNWTTRCPVTIINTVTNIHTYIFINPRSRMTIQDAKTVSDEIEKGAKK